jgi:hypothetical protein
MKHHDGCYNNVRYRTLEFPNPRVLCRGSSPNFICSHIPLEIFLVYIMGKKWGNKKRVVYVRGGSCTRAFSWGLGAPLDDPLPSGERTRTSPTTKYHKSHLWASLKLETLDTLIQVSLCDLKWENRNWRAVLKCDATWKIEKFQVFLFIIKISNFKSFSWVDLLNSFSFCIF